MSILNESNDQPDSFWVDVGGTFTDCIGRSRRGGESVAKVLSSGIVKGVANFGGLDRSRFVDSGRRADPADFWVGCRLRWIDSDGELMGESEVVRSQGAEFHTADPAPGATPFLAYELAAEVPAPILGIRMLMGCPIGVALPDVSLYLGTTRGTNALLTRSGARTGLVTTRGFGDLLRIGDQTRPHLFSLVIRKPAPLFDEAVEIDERILADGTVEQPLDEDQAREQLRHLRDRQVDSIAICLMHGYRYAQHERIVGRMARQMGFRSVRLSHEVAPMIKMVDRGETTVLDAYLNPVIADYLDEIQRQLSAASRLRLMTSSGGLVAPARFSGKDSVLSGPAGGVVGAARVAEQIGIDRAIGFDMGGTSTDVARYDGQFEHEFESTKAGVRIMTPMLAIETVAAGGGSICAFDGARMTVGPRSAGADPGPACYGRGGPLTVTDINLLLGYVDGERFPFPLNVEAARRRLAELAALVRGAGFDKSNREIAEGFRAIANQNMAAAIRNVSVTQGYDPREFLLVSFGGAAAQHACAVAECLEMTRILDHPHASLLSAVGIGLADVSAHAIHTLLQPWDSCRRDEMELVIRRLKEQVVAALEQDGVPADQIVFHVGAELRYEGTEAGISVEWGDAPRMQRDFLDSHRRLFGFVQRRPLECVLLRVEGVCPGHRLSPIDLRCELAGATPREGSRFEAAELKSGDRIIGPAIVYDQFKSTVIEPGWRATRLTNGSLYLERVAANASERSGPAAVNLVHAADQEPDPVRLEIFNNAFTSIARQMGASLRRTSVSVNVRERMDFSCAIFTDGGDLVVNAPHIPVHLGAMSETVKCAIRDNPTVRPGDVFVTNDPFAGGSHLPDITVVKPVFCGDRAVPSFWVASRSHHAEIGGTAPGSMPASARHLSEEGVLIRNFKLIDAGSERFDRLRELLTSGPWPSRDPDLNLTDIAAQVAANQTGERELLKLVEKYSLDIVRAYMQWMQDAAEVAARRAIGRLPDGQSAFSDAMDDGSVVAVRIDKSADRLTIDFTGTGPVCPGNLNANPAIVKAAVIYVLRCMVDRDLPLNEGLMRPVSLVIPAGSLLNPIPGETPEQSPAVVGGNVETSQRVVDVLLGALDLAAASQGTMNNWLMGDATFGYYETVCGGAGATADAPGADAVHTHMTNTRLTDPEVLEVRMPVILRRFAIRSNSGGAGRHRGGHGAIREIEFLKPLTVSLLTSRRTTRPFGMHGGEDGQPGRNRLVRVRSVFQMLAEQAGRGAAAKPMDANLPTGLVEVELASQCRVEVEPGDRLILETPGGGAWGTPP